MNLFYLFPRVEIVPNQIQWMDESLWLRTIQNEFSGLFDNCFVAFIFSTLILAFFCGPKEPAEYQSNFPYVGIMIHVLE